MGEQADMRVLDGVAREMEVANAGNLVTRPFDEDEKGRAAGEIVRIEHEDRRTPLHIAKDRAPGRGRGRIGVIVFADLGPPLRRARFTRSRRTSSASMSRTVSKS